MLWQHTAFLHDAMIGPVVMAMTQPTALGYPPSVARGHPSVTGTAQGHPSSTDVAQGHAGGTNMVQGCSSSTSTAQGHPISIYLACGHPISTHSPGTLTAPALSGGNPIGTHHQSGCTGGRPQPQLSPAPSSASYPLSCACSLPAVKYFLGLKQ